MKITLNGAPRQLPEDATVAELLAELGLGPAGVAVERNEELVPREARADTRLSEGDQVEVVTLVGGG